MVYVIKDFWKYNILMNPHARLLVGWSVGRSVDLLVGWSVCYNFQKWQGVTLPTCSMQNIVVYIHTVLHALALY